MNKFFQKLIVYTALAAGVMGCSDKKSESIKNSEPVMMNYTISNIPMMSESGCAIATGDFDNNGTLDFIMAAEEPSNTKHTPAHAYLVLNNGNGTYASPKKVAEIPMMSESGCAIATGDFDNNGTLDFIMAAEEPSNTKHTPAHAYLVLNNGNGTYESPKKVAKIPMMSESGCAIATGDFDNNGTLDFIMAAEEPSNTKHTPAHAYIFSNNGKANFSQK